ncbi:MAG: DUF3795 domain-containing protein [Clostridiales bacterium]|nr:DUF3795 domain-containing protein [Clostridiales bacterium]
MLKEHPTLGCCGIDCGLCPRYYTEGPSKCPGCFGEGFFDKHPSCAFITCCVKKRSLEICALCPDFPCIKFEKETGEKDSFVTHRRVMHNQNFIKEHGIDKFLEQQNERINILKKMLANYNDGNCKNLFCLAAALLSLDNLKKALKDADQEVRIHAISQNDYKIKAKIMKAILSEFAVEENVELVLKKA